MKRFTLWFLAAFLLMSGRNLFAEGNSSAMDDSPIPTTAESTPESISSEPEEAPKPVVKKVVTKQKAETANSFVAGADWEFDGFVAGGQDEAVKSMFYQGDTIYLNIGSQQGLNSGERVLLYRRGNKVKDPRSGRFMGFEVRLAGIAQVTDRIDGNTCSVRIIKSNEAVEIGDLAKRSE